MLTFSFFGTSFASFRGQIKSKREISWVFKAQKNKKPPPPPLCASCFCFIAQKFIRFSLRSLASFFALQMCGVAWQWLLMLWLHNELRNCHSKRFWWAFKAKKERKNRFGCATNVLWCDKSFRNSPLSFSFSLLARVCRRLPEKLEKNLIFRCLNEKKISNFKTTMINMSLSVSFRASLLVMCLNTCCSFFSFRLTLQVDLKTPKKNKETFFSLPHVWTSLEDKKQVESHSEIWSSGFEGGLELFSSSFFQGGSGCD